MANNNNGTFRVELPIDLQDIVKDMAEMTGQSHSRPRDVVISAISNLHWILGKTSNGYAILAEKDGRCVELDAPYLSKSRAIGSKKAKESLATAG